MPKYSRARLPGSSGVGKLLCFSALLFLGALLALFLFRPGATVTVPVPETLPDWITEDCCR